jgi:MFS family permease
MKKVHPLLITSVALFINGISSGLVPFVKAYWLFILYSILFGFSIAFHVSLFTINLVELVGLDHLTSAFGLLILFQGFAFLVGNPAFGALVDSTDSYDLTFWLMGCLMIAASLLLIPTLFLARAPGRKQKG